MRHTLLHVAYTVIETTLPLRLELLIEIMLELKWLRINILDTYGTYMSPILEATCRAQVRCMPLRMRSIVSKVSVPQSAEKTVSGWSTRSEANDRLLWRLHQQEAKDRPIRAETVYSCTAKLPQEIDEEAQPIGW